MKTIFKFDKVILTKELNDKFNHVGDVFEVVNILEDSFMLRSENTKVTIGIVSFTDFEKHFVAEENYKGWTNWQPLIGFDGQNDCEYRSNRKKTQVRFLTSKIKAEACCDNRDEFSLSFGVRMAYLRCLNKAWEMKKAELEEQLKIVNSEIAENEMILKKMSNYN